MHTFNWYFTVFKKYAVFSGRARRKEYWYFVLYNVLVIIALSELDLLTGTYNWKLGAGLLSGLYTVAMLCPSLAVLTRRLHDIGRSERWVIWGMLVPMIITGICNMLAAYLEYGLSGTQHIILFVLTGLSSIVIGISILLFLIFACLPSQSGTNKYGPNPLNA